MTQRQEENLTGTQSAPAVSQLGELLRSCRIRGQMPSGEIPSEERTS